MRADERRRLREAFPEGVATVRQLVAAGCRNGPPTTDVSTAGQGRARYRGWSYCSPASRRQVRDVGFVHVERTSRMPLPWLRDGIPLTPSTRRRRRGAFGSKTRRQRALVVDRAPRAVVERTRSHLRREIPGDSGLLARRRRDGVGDRVDRVADESASTTGRRTGGELRGCGRRLCRIETEAGVHAAGRGRADAPQHLPHAATRPSPDLRATRCEAPPQGGAGRAGAVSGWGRRRGC